MIEPIVVTILPVLFLIVLFGGGALFRRRSIDMDGEPPIGKGLFYSSKYAILVLWGAMVLHSWGIGLAFVEVPGLLKWVALVPWAADSCCSSSGGSDSGTPSGSGLPGRAPA